MAHAGQVAVYGATGHTGKFVLDELRRRGLSAVAVARDVSRWTGAVPAHAARIDDPAALDRAFAGCAVVINCAGPFLDTAVPIVQAALRAKAHYLDVTAEQASAQATFDAFDAPARAAGVTVIPAAGFYGGLADLLASALLGQGPADDISTAVALDHWWPTEGTRITGERNRVPRLIVADGQLAPLPVPPQTPDWSFAAPFGTQAMVELSFSEIITIARHLPVRSVRSYLSAAPLEELRDTATPAPAAIDPLGRSAQRFMMEVVAAGAAGERRAVASGQDIYAVSAPLVVEAAERLLAPGFHRPGAQSLGQAFDAADFLDALAPAHLAINFIPG